MREGSRKGPRRGVPVQEGGGVPVQKGGSWGVPGMVPVQEGGASCARKGLGGFLGQFLSRKGGGS